LRDFHGLDLNHKEIMTPFKPTAVRGHRLEHSVFSETPYGFNGGSLKGTGFVAHLKTVNCHELESPKASKTAVLKKWKTQHDTTCFPGFISFLILLYSFRFRHLVIL